MNPRANSDSGIKPRNKLVYYCQRFIIGCVDIFTLCNCKLFAVPLYRYMYNTGRRKKISLVQLG